MWAASGRRIPEYFPPCVPEHGVALFGFILRLVDGDRQRAEDVVHETLLRAWKHPAALHPYRENPRPWLFTVARHLVIDERRARRTSPAVPTFTRLRHSWYGVSQPPVMPTAGEGARPSVRGKRQSPPRGGKSHPRCISRRGFELLVL
jgi:DNA-directed RNA polymerase specialized sigma24 family protein